MFHLKQQPNAISSHDRVDMQSISSAETGACLACMAFGTLTWAAISRSICGVVSRLSVYSKIATIEMHLTGRLEFIGEIGNAHILVGGARKYILKSTQCNFTCLLRLFFLAFAK